MSPPYLPAMGLVPLPSLGCAPGRAGAISSPVHQDFHRLGVLLGERKGSSQWKRQPRESPGKGEDKSCPPESLPQARWILSFWTESGRGWGGHLRKKS